MLKNFTKINEWLFTSARPSPDDLNFLYSTKISAIVSLTENPLFFLPDAIRYLHIPIPDFSIP
ncbi:MAG: hypothetical protein QXT63_09510, partial [Thermoplasmata archaeon]